jgi:hypothetical protein
VACETYVNIWKPLNICLSSPLKNQSDLMCSDEASYKLRHKYLRTKQKTELIKLFEGTRVTVKFHLFDDLKVRTVTHVHSHQQPLNSSAIFQKLNSL